MPRWRKGDPYYIHPNPDMLEGVAAIATYLGIGYNTAHRWIMECNLPAIKSDTNRWITCKQAILAWLLEGIEHSSLPQDPVIQSLLTRTISRAQLTSLDTSASEDIVTCPYSGNILEPQSHKMDRPLIIGTGAIYRRS